MESYADRPLHSVAAYEQLRHFFGIQYFIAAVFGAFRKN